MDIILDGRADSPTHDMAHAPLHYTVARKIRRARRIAWWVMAVLAVLIGIYGIMQVDGRSAKGTVFGQAWIDRVHFIGGGIALIVGALALHRGVLRRAPRAHRACGAVYLTCVAASGGAGLAMATQSALGMWTHFGFGGLGLTWITTSALGLRAIRRGDVLTHHRWMVRSYAACYGAVMLRLLSWPLGRLFGDFGTSYMVVSWACWVPNMVFAEVWLRRTDPLISAPVTRTGDS